MSVPSPRTPADVLKRISELELETDGHVANQHILSKPVLKGFAAPGGKGKGWQLYSFDLRYPNNVLKPKGLSACGSIKDYVQFASASAEQLWGLTETKLPAALDAVKNGRLFDTQEHVDTIRDCIALHYARSIAAHEMHYRVFVKVLVVQKNDLLSHPDFLAWLYYKRHGLYPAGIQAYEHIVDELFAPSVERAGKGQFLRTSVERFFKSARTRLSSFGLEIAVAKEGEFLIGDTPVLTMRKGYTSIGPLEGIPLGDADYIIMPLGRRHAVGVAKTNGYREVTQQDVEYNNLLQVRAARRRLYFNRKHSVIP